MSIELTDTAYLENTTDPDWGGTGTIFLRVLPGFVAAEGTNRAIFVKSPEPFGVNFFSLQKETDNVAKFGFYVTTDFRLTVAEASAFTQFVFANHCFTWDTGAPNQEWYVDNSLVASSASAFAVPTGNNYLRFGNFRNTGGGALFSSLSYFAGHGRWNRVLTASERMAVHITGCPLFVPNGLVEYHPMAAPTGAGRDLRGTTPLTLTGTPAQAGVSYIILPESGRSEATARTPVGLEVMPPVIANPVTLYAPSFVQDLAISPPVIANPVTLYAPSVVFDGTLLPPVIANPITLYAPAITLASSSLPAPITAHEVDSYAVRGMLETWNLFVKVGLTDGMVAGASTLADIQTLADGLLSHSEYMRIRERVTLMLARSEELGVLSDSVISTASSTAAIHDYILSFLPDGVDDGDIYSSYIQGT